MKAPFPLVAGFVATLVIAVCVTSLYAQEIDDRVAPTPTSGTPLASVESVSAGFAHTCAVLTSGLLECWGDNVAGQLGTGDKVERLYPAEVQGLSHITQVAAGYRHTCALLDGGDVQCWGDGSHGQLGNGSTADQLSPVRVAGLTGVKQIVAGRFHTCALTVSKDIFCWGDNQFGQVGNDTTDAMWLTPQAVTGLDAVGLHITAGFDHSCAAQTSGMAWCWGRNDQGQLGNTRHGAGEFERQPQTVSNGFDVVKVAAGGTHTCAVVNDGSLLCWGAGASGQLGDGLQTLRPSANPVAQFASGGAEVALGAAHSCALTTGGALHCWGSNEHGQLGAGADAVKLTPAGVAGLASGVRAISTGAHHSCAVTTDSHLMCWGLNDSGQLGTGDKVSQPYPVAVLEPPACYTLTLAHAGNGGNPVATPPASPFCAAGNFIQGAVIALAATPASGWAVAGWSGTDDDASQGSTNFLTMPAADASANVTYTRSLSGLYLPAVRR